MKPAKLTTGNVASTLITENSHENSKNNASGAFCKKKKKKKSYVRCRRIILMLVTTGLMRRLKASNGCLRPCEALLQNFLNYPRLARR
jgi:hypothetical protein